MKAWRHKAAIVAVWALATLLSIGAASAQSGFPCRRWLELHTTSKDQLIQGLLEMSRKNGIAMALSPAYYVRELDTLIGRYAEKNDQRALDTSLGFTVHIIAAMEGDWGNGEDPLEHAKVFFKDWFLTFQSLYPKKYQHLVDFSRAMREGTSPPPQEEGRGPR